MSQSLSGLYRGDTLTLSLSFKDSAGDPLDITGWKLYLTIKKNITDTDDDAVVSMEEDTHSDPTGGITSFKVPAADTHDLLGRHYYDIQVKRPNGDISTIVNSTMIFLEDVTRRVS